MKNRKLLLSVTAFLAFGTLGYTQLDKIIKVGGVVLAVNTFGKDMNKGINKLTGHKDTEQSMTKIVTILSVGINQSNALGAAHVRGPSSKLDKVVAVAQPEANLMAKGRLNALLPVSNKYVHK